MSSPSDAPVRVAGSHTRSGNAMARTRAAILDAAAGCVAHRGVRRTTMTEVAVTGDIAKATLYNHFRTKDDLLDALVLSRVGTLGAQCVELAEKGLAAALEHAAHQLAALPALRGAVRDEPVLAAALVVPGAGRSWDAARSVVVAVLRQAGARQDAPAADLVLRWVVGQAVWPGTREEVALGARLLEEGLGRIRLEVGQAPAASGLGWPD